LNITWEILNHQSLPTVYAIDRTWEYSILQYATITLDVYQVCRSVGHCVKNGSCSSLSWE